MECQNESFILLLTHEKCVMCHDIIESYIVVVALQSFLFLQCNPGGCLMELCIQLAIIMVGKQAYGTVLEMVIP